MYGKIRIAVPESTVVRAPQGTLGFQEFTRNKICASKL